ncbi:kinesin-like protein [Achlya hypogyna]|uniref:Kinesin-like protein n=1 Tax=Achlya hypogyna TaxID=1202772 RepID=A0A1V9YDY6_ACHHY|nr:kinesin-like protein [Achlya hypogyna]
MQPSPMHPVLYEKYQPSGSMVPTDLVHAGSSLDVVAITCKGGARLLVSKKELEALELFIPNYEEIDMRRLVNTLPMLLEERDAAAKTSYKQAKTNLVDPTKDARIRELEKMLEREMMNVERHECEILTLKETLLRKDRSDHEASLATKELFARLDHAKQENEDLHAHFKDETSALAEKHARAIEALSAKAAAELAATHDKYQSDIATSTSQFNREIDDLNAKLKSLMVVIHGKDDELTADRATIATLSSDLAAMTARLEAANAQIAATNADLDALRADHAATTSTLAQVSTEKASKEENIVALTSQLRTVEAKAEGLYDHTQGLVAELAEMRSELLTEATDMQQYVTNAMESVLTESQEREKVLYDHLQRETLERKRMTEKYHEVSGKIRVFCRIRPLKVATNEESAYMYPKPQTLLVASQRKEFVFDQIYGPDSTQEQVYEHIDPLVGSVMDGYNACVLAYGQTGAGKTYSMVGEPHAPGIIPRALQQLFAMSTARQLMYEDRISISMQEIYNDQPRDLLSKDILTAKDTLETRPVSSWEEVQQVLDEGHKNRSVASTKMNIESSRSHAIIFVYVASASRQSLEKKNSTLCLVDLAGSERISRTQVTGDRLKEAQHINKSLSTLGDVVHALQHKAKHVPYRNSKLTFTLRDMLSGGAKALMMLQVSPDLADVGESLCSLQFGARVSQVELGAAKQTSVESGELLSLKDELAKQKLDSEKETTRLRLEIDQLREELETRSTSHTTMTAASSKASNQSGDENEPADDEWKRLNTDSEPEPEAKKRGPRASLGSTSSRLSSSSSKSSTPAAVPKPTRTTISRRLSLPVKATSSSVTAPTAASTAAAAPTVRAKSHSTVTRPSRHSIGPGEATTVRAKMTAATTSRLASKTAKPAAASSPPPRKWV